MYFLLTEIFFNSITRWLAQSKCLFVFVFVCIDLAEYQTNQLLATEKNCWALAKAKVRMKDTKTESKAMQTTHKQQTAKEEEEEEKIQKDTRRFFDNLINRFSPLICYCV